uniref:Putative glycosyltransferase n=1 Tax=viral metagenome TaxID=1070528 RepID=A0A6M3KZN8_9ZZZZ
MMNSKAYPLVICCGRRRNVMKMTGGIKWILSKLDQFEKSVAEMIIVSDKENIDIFSSITSFKTKLMPLNAETFLIVKFLSKELEVNPIFSYCEDDLSRALMKDISYEDRYTLSILDTSKNFRKFVNYFFEKPSYPIDIVHSKIKKGNKKFLIGINIGEDEHPTMRPTFTFLSELIARLKILLPCKIVLFGGPISNNDNLLIREGMIKNRTGTSDIISFIKEAETAPITSQAISLCNVFISHDSFLLHLANAVQTKSIGLFGNTCFDELLVRTIHAMSPTREFECRPCEKQECRLMETENGNCFENIPVKEVVRLACNLLKEGVVDGRDKLDRILTDKIPEG